MQNFVAQYRSFFAQPDTTRIVLISLIARMPIGMMSFAMLMFLRDALGSFALAGSVVGAYFIAMAVTAPVQGRLIDRIGPRAPLLVTGIIQPAALASIGAAGVLGWGYGVIVPLAMLAGAFTTPINTLSRTLWRYRFEDGLERKTAYAIDSVAIEVNFTIGPAIIALLLAFASPTWAYAFAVTMAAVAVMVFWQTPAFKYWRREPLAKRHLLGPLTDLRLLIVFACNFGLAFSFGVLEVTYAGFATTAGAAALAGVLIGLNSIGSATGGLLYGGLHLRTPLERQFASSLALLAAMVGLHSLVSSPWIMGALALASGLLIAPALTAQTLLISRIAPPKYATEAFTWSSTFIVSGIGIGTAAAGWMIEHRGVPSAFLIGAVSLMCSTLIALTMRAARHGPLSVQSEN
ncbi:MAG: MFS transporter [Burkholderiaceae bacterium]